MCLSSRPYVPHVPPIHHSWFAHPNNIQWGIQIMKFLITQYPAVPPILVWLRSQRTEKAESSRHDLVLQSQDGGFGSQAGCRLRWLRIFLLLRFSARQMLLQYRKWGHGRFFPNTLKFIIHYSSYHLTLQRALPWFRRLVAGGSLHSSGFEFMPVSVEICGGQSHAGTGFPPRTLVFLWLYNSTNYTHVFFFVCHRRYL
jgi:hypothetical protein